MTKKPLIVIALILLVIGVGVGLFVSTNGASKIPKGYTKVNEYVYPEANKVHCDAVLPQCGVCRGKVIDHECFVKE